MAGSGNDYVSRHWLIRYPGWRNPRAGRYKSRRRLGLNSRARLRAPPRGDLAPHETHFISDGSGGCHPAATWTANAARPQRAAGTEDAAASRSRGGRPQASAPGPLGCHLRRLGCPAVGEFPPRVLAPKGALGGPEKARGHLPGQIPAGPPGKSKCAARWWGALEECDSLASTCCPEELAPWRA